MLWSCISTYFVHSECCGISKMLQKVITLTPSCLLCCIMDFFVVFTQQVKRSYIVFNNLLAKFGCKHFSSWYCLARGSITPEGIRIIVSIAVGSFTQIRNPASCQTVAPLAYVYTTHTTDQISMLQLRKYIHTQTIFGKSLKLLTSISTRSRQFELICLNIPLSLKPTPDICPYNIIVIHLITL